MLATKLILEVSTSLSYSVAKGVLINMCNLIRFVEA